MKNTNDYQNPSFAKMYVNNGGAESCCSCLKLFFNQHIAQTKMIFVIFPNQSYRLKKKKKNLKKKV